MRIRSFGASDVGRRREKNEDSYLVNDELALYAVADGMGGHSGGDIASHIAVETIDEVVTALERDPDMTLLEGITFKPGEYQGYLRYAVKLASQRIFERSNSNSELRGMGTTTVSLLFRDNKVYIANVGDSRAYRLRDENIMQMTQDHSLVSEQMRAGILTADEARTSRLKNIITRSVGFQEEVDADIDIRVAREGDIFLLCSDGLSNLLEDHEIRDIVATNALEKACRRLIDIANERGGDDNITVVIVSVDGLDEEKLKQGSDDVTVDDATIDDATIEIADE